MDDAAPTDWLDKALVAEMLGDDGLVGQYRFNAVCDAVASWVVEVRADLLTVPDPDDPDAVVTFNVTNNVQVGACMVAVDAYRNPDGGPGAGSPVGDLTLGLGATNALDPMAERLLGIGRARRGGRIG